MIPESPSVPILLWSFNCDRGETIDFQETSVQEEHPHVGGYSPLMIFKLYKQTIIQYQRIQSHTIFWWNLVMLEDINTLSASYQVCWGQPSGTWATRISVLLAVSKAQKFIQLHNNIYIYNYIHINHAEAVISLCGWPPKNNMPSFCASFAKTGSFHSRPPPVRSCPRRPLSAHAGQLESWTCWNHSILSAFQCVGI